MKRHTLDFYVSKDGNNRWSGTRPSPDRQGCDGPFATIAAAQRAVRAFRRQDPQAQRTIRIHLREGTHFLNRPLTLGPADSGLPERGQWNRIEEPAHPVIYRAYRNETAILSGGRRITGWTVGERNGRRVWTADLPAVREGRWHFRQLWVNGERRERPRLPRSGEYRIQRVLDARFKGTWRETVLVGAKRFGYAAGDINPKWKNLSDVELQFLPLWISVRVGIRSVDPRRRIVHLDRKSQFRLTDEQGRGAPYTVENVFEALQDPGQWNLDRAEGRLYYLPRPGETPDTAEVIAPRLPQILRLEGKPGKGAKVRNVIFEDLVFSHNEWTPPPDWSGSIQGAYEVCGAGSIRHARDCDFRRCTVAHTNTYGIDLPDGCEEIRISRCRLYDLGAGGVKIHRGNRQNIVSDCEIGDGGRVYPDGQGVFVGRSSGNRILHNHIHDFYASGIAVGWEWACPESLTDGNVIEWNHVHDLGKGRLSDLGGIYTMCVSPGTRIRYNLVHDISARQYGAAGIYTDEGSSYILIENNLVYRTHHAAYMHHFGHDNEVRNNIFAYDGWGLLCLGRAVSRRSYVMERNIFLNRNSAIIGPGYGKPAWSPEVALFRNNLYWSERSRTPRFDGMTFAQWRRTGTDEGSRVADPCFVCPAEGDFRLKKTSPAFRLGFVPFDLSNVGPRHDSACQPAARSCET